MKDDELTLWEEDEPSIDVKELSLWEEEKNFGQNGDEDISLWSDNEDLPPISQLLLHEGDKLELTLPKGFNDWTKMARCYEWYYNHHHDGNETSSYYEETSRFIQCLKGAVLYGSDDKEKWWEGSVYIKEAASRKDPIGMRQRAIVLLEGIICDRDRESALKWLHMAARAGDLKALRILVYSLFGMEKILVAPRENAKREDEEGRFIKISDLFDEVHLSRIEKLHYVKALIDLTMEYYRIQWKGELWRRSYTQDRPLLTLVYGYLIRMYEVDKEKLDTGRLLKDWGSYLYAEIRNDPLYDGVLISNKESKAQQIANLCKIFNEDEEELENPLTWNWNPRSELGYQSGHYINLIDTSRKGNEEGIRLKCRTLEIRKWPWRKLRKIVCVDGYYQYFAPFYVYCMEQMVDRFFREEIDCYDEREVKKFSDVKSVFDTNRFLGELDKYTYGYKGYKDSNNYKYFIEKEKQYWERVKKLPDSTRSKLNLISPGERKNKIKDYVKEYTKNYSAEEFSALKEAAAGNEWPLEASYLLGLRYEYGQGIEADWSEAVKYFKKAERSLFKNNCKKHLERLEPQTEFFREMKNLLPLLHSPQAATAAEKIKEMAGKDFSPAMLVMAKQMLENEQFKRSDYYFPYDPQKGFKLLKDAAQLRNMSAMYELVLIGRNGKYGYEINEALAKDYQRMQETTIYQDLLLE
jgi:TPR repeat protein